MKRNIFIFILLSCLSITGIANAFERTTIVDSSFLSMGSYYGKGEIFATKLEYLISTNYRNVRSDRLLPCDIKGDTCVLNVKESGVYAVFAGSFIWGIYQPEHGKVTDVKDGPGKLLREIKNYSQYPDDKANDVSLQSIFKALRVPDVGMDINYYRSMLTDAMIYKLASENRFDSIFVIKKNFKYTPNITSLNLIDFFENREYKRFIRYYWGQEIFDLLAYANDIVYQQCIDAAQLAKYADMLKGIASGHHQLFSDHPYLFKIDTVLPASLVFKNTSLTSVDFVPLLKGKYTILYFWGTWCGPCIRIGEDVLPELYKLTQRNDSIQLITVSAEGKSRIEKWKTDIQENKSNYLNFIGLSDTKNGWSGSGTCPELQKLRVFMVPNFFLTDPSGKILLRNDINGSCVREEMKKYVTLNEAE